jgi:DNA-binding transcriptional LysR family regulator
MLANLAWAIYGRKADFEGQSFDPQNLMDQKWVSLGDNFAHLHAAKYVRQNVAPENIVFKLNTVLGLTEAIAEGIGIGPLPCFIADKNPDLMRLSVTEESFATKLWLLTHPDLRAAQRVRAFMDFMAQEITKERALIEGRSD